MNINTYEIRKWVVRVFLAIILAFWLLALVATAVAYSQTGVEIPLEQVHRGESGERFLDAEISTTDEQLGLICEATLDRRNNSSIHAVDGHPEHGTNLIIVSGVNTATFANIESKTFDVATRAFVIDGDILVYTQIGEDKVSSMGFLLEFECNPPITTTTTKPEPSSTTTTTPGVSTSTTLAPPVTTTTEPPPINGVDTGGGACADGACDDEMPWQAVVLVAAGLTVLGGLAFREWLHHGGDQ